MPWTQWVNIRPIQQWSLGRAQEHSQNVWEKTTCTFLIHGGNEEFKVKSYTKANSQTENDDSCLQLGIIHFFS